MCASICVINEINCLVDTLLTLFFTFTFPICFVLTQLISCFSRPSMIFLNCSHFIYLNIVLNEKHFQRHSMFEMCNINKESLTHLLYAAYFLTMI